MRYGATHRGFESRPLRHPAPLGCSAARDGLLPSTGRARRGTSGALYLQSAPAGLNPLSRSPLSKAALSCDVEGRVPRSGDSRTGSGPEGSSPKRCSSGAADRPGPSRRERWARERPDRRRVHGNLPSPIQPAGRGSLVTAPHQALYRRWRAQTFGQIVGQEAVVTTLRNAVRSDRVAHALLFVGPRGTRKTSMARIVAHALNCTDLRDGEPCDACTSCVAIREGRALDVAELDAASNNKVDDIRELLRSVVTTPSDLRRKVFIIDEVQRIKEGWDVLLKTLEEPPEGVLFVFCTTDPSQIRPAVVSRLQRFTFRPLTRPEIEGKLRRILESERRSMEPDAVSLVAELAAGGMRDAESMLDQVLSNADDPITSSQIRDLLGLAEADAVERFI